MGPKIKRLSRLSALVTVTPFCLTQGPAETAHFAQESPSKLNHDNTPPMNLSNPVLWTDALLKSII